MNFKKRLSQKVNKKYSNNENNISAGLICLQPVSYTHLDVYKRQEHNPALFKYRFFIHTATHPFMLYIFYIPLLSSF